MTDMRTAAMHWRFSASSVFILTLCVSTLVDATPKAEDSRPVGTYDMIICKKRCSFADTTAVIATARVVLSSQALPIRDRDQVYPFLIQPEEARACFVTKEVRKADTFAALSPSGFSAWKVTKSEIEFSLFRSADAGYTVDAKLNTDGFVGHGTSWGAGAAKTTFSPDVVVARRIGTVDLSVCNTL